MVSFGFSACAKRTVREKIKAMVNRIVRMAFFVNYVVLTY
jgi:hypothetical protein